MDSIFDRICIGAGLFLIFFGAASIDSEDQTIPYCALAVGVVILIPLLIKSIKDGQRGR